MPLQPRTSYAVRKKLRPFYTGGNVEWDTEGSYVVAQSGDAVTKVSQATGDECGRFQVEEDPVTTFVLSPEREFIVTAHKSGLLRQWKYSDGEQLRVWKSFHTGPIPVLACEFTSTLVASGGSDWRVKVWDVVRNYCTHNLKGCRGVVSVVMFHKPDENSPIRVFAASTDNSILGWNLKTSSDPEITLEGHISTVTAIEAAPDPDILVSCSRDGIIRVWKISEQKALKAIAAMESLEALKFLPPGSFESTKLRKPFFVTGGSRGSLRVWSLPAGKIVGRQSISASQNESEDLPSQQEGPGILRLQVTNSPDAGYELQAVTVDHNLLTYDLPGFDLRGRLVGYNDEILDARYVGKKDQFVAVASNATIVKVYDVESTSCDFLEGHTDSVICLGRWAKIPNLFASGSKDKSVLVWKYSNEEMPDGGRRKWFKCAEATGHTASVSALCCSHGAGGDRFWLASASEDNTIKLWSMKEVPLGKQKVKNVVTLTALHTEIAHDKTINSVCFSPNDALLATGSLDHTAKLWSVNENHKSGFKLRGVFRGHRRGVWTTEFSPVDQVLATGSTDSTIRLWSIADFSCLKTFEGHGSSVVRLAFINGGTQLLSASADGMIKMWSVKTALCSLTLDEHEDKIWALDVNESGTEFVTGSTDATLILWKDDTEEKMEKQATEKNLRIEQEQLLANLLLDEKWLKALGLTLTLEQPFKALTVIRAIMNTGSGEFTELRETLGKLKDDQIAVLIRFVSVWNTNAKNYFPAQLTLNILLKQRTIEELIKLPTVAKALPGLITYSKKHKARLERLRQASSFIRFIHESVKVTAGDDVSILFNRGKFLDHMDVEAVKEELESDTESGVVENGDESAAASDSDESEAGSDAGSSGDEEPKGSRKKESFNVEDLEGNLEAGPDSEDEEVNVAPKWKQQRRSQPIRDRGT
ncbi:unnamed protein product [Notodromas monacha]|uniref:U3 small nucleolar RNA-associated protein 13 C-terminal domain-containing protein n=1 Tax=Notodromas monacha TaxID=399045 RepID=A0A7R9G980_9CRUS|nr:unnamed protein product [Notodromas monacha]CAG0912559.1 unnamed protein product [Notodromas monacha]